MLIFSERQLIGVLSEYEKNHYNRHRPHRALGQLPPIPDSDISSNDDGAVVRTEVLGGLINEYRHAA